MLDGRALMEETALAVESQPARLAQAAKKRLVHRNILRCLDSAPVIRELEGVRNLEAEGEGEARRSGALTTTIRGGLSEEHAHRDPGWGVLVCEGGDVDGRRDDL